MSRSIHETRKMLRDAHREEMADFAKKEKRLGDLRNKLERKRKIKGQIRSERKGERMLASEEILIETTDPASIPIIVEDEGEFVHYPASPDDLRAVMRRLPCGVCGGLSKIVLCLGKGGTTNNPDEFRNLEPDPYTKRLGGEIFPDVWAGRFRSDYDDKKAEIHLLALVYPPRLRDREIWEVVLRMLSLDTFVKMIAYHSHYTRRRARGRWIDMEGGKTDSFAEQQAYDWIHNIVIPYLEETYPEETKRIQDWIEHFGGIRLTLDYLAGDRRITQNYERTIFNIHNALSALADDAYEYKDLAETRTEFADELHMMGDYENSMVVVEQVLTEWPDYIPACILKGEILVHLEQYERACQILRAVLAEEPEDTDAMLQLAFAYEGLKRWGEVIRVIDRIMEVDPRERKRIGTRIFRIRILIEMGDYDAAEPDLRFLEASDYSRAQRKAREFREAIEKRLGGETGEMQG